MSLLNEDVVEQHAISLLLEMGFTYQYGPDIAFDGLSPERTSYSDVFLNQRLADAIQRINPGFSGDVYEDVQRKLFNISGVSLIQTNRMFHRALVKGITIEVPQSTGGQRHIDFKLIDFINPEINDFLAVNQFTVVEGNSTRRADIVVFINGIPISLLELKNAASDGATVINAFNQVQTYKREISSLFTPNELIVISDGMEAFIGSLTSDRERFMPWRTIDGEGVASNSLLKLEVLIKGVFDKQRLLHLIRNFVVFEDADDGSTIKKIAGYHQFHAVRKAVQETVRAAKPKGDRRVGVVWHTQGSGKSLTMAFYAGALIHSPELENPTIVVLTDRNDLDEQLFGTFSKCKELFNQEPQQADNRDQLKKLLAVASGGVIFTTIQKFLPEGSTEKFPLLSDRRNIIVMADEAHRSQYGFGAKGDAKTGVLQAGFAQHLRDGLPNASFVGFTGTPIELSDKNTRTVFGDYISIYDIQQAVEDKATVPIYYESRLAKLQLNESQKPDLDSEFEEITEGEEDSAKEKQKSKWAQLEALVGSESRLKQVAQDIVDHFSQRQEAMNGGKAMIVCMSRRICVELYAQIIKLRPNWDSNDETKGALKVIMTGSASDPENYQPHVRSKKKREDLANRFRNAKDEFQLVIVRDMWLTGFDAPCMHTLYIDKPMQGHGLMQAIARVNRVYKGKEGGLIVDYLGIADQLKKALATYTESGGRGKGAFDQEEAVAVMLEKYELAVEFFRGFDWSLWSKGTPAQRLQLLPAACEHVLKQEDGKAKFVKLATELSKAFSLSVPHDESTRIRNEVAFFQTVRTVLTKPTGMTGRTQEDLEFELRQLVSKALASDGVIDVFAAAGLNKPNLSILSEEFLAEIKGMPHKNLAVELLARLLNDEIKIRRKRNLVQSRTFSEMLENALKKYQNRAIETAQVIEELIALAKDIGESKRRGESLGLTEDEEAFYDALEVNDSAVKVLGDKILRDIARDLVKAVRENITVDWSERETSRAKIKVIVKRLLKKYGYPPDKQEKATQTVLEQAELLCKEGVF